MDLHKLDPLIVAKGLEGHEQLKALDMSENEIKDDYFARVGDALISCTSLLDLNLTKNMINGQSLMHLLKNSPSLQVLSNLGEQAFKTI
jgi:hypothetical protein